MSPTKKPPFILPLNDLEERAAQEEADRYATMPIAEIEAELRANGQDPDALRAQGLAFVAGLIAKRERLEWQIAAAEGLSKKRRHVEQKRGAYADLPRAELLARLDIARVDPRFAQPVAVMFRNQRTDEATDEELRAILEEIDALADEKD